MSVAQLNTRQLILFDLDGTLVDSAADLYRSMNMSLAALNMPLVTEKQIREWVGKGAAKLCESVLIYLYGVVEADLLDRLLHLFVKTYAEQLCVNTTIYHGVEPFLMHCQQRQLKMACVTNKPVQLAQGILAQLNLSTYFDLVLGGDSLEKRKPHPLPILHSMQTFQVDAEHTLMIGDSSNDVEAARRAGIDCIVVSYGYNHGERIEDCRPQQIVDSLVELII